MTGPNLPHATDLTGAQIIPLKAVVLARGISRPLDFTLSDMYDRIGPQRSVYIDNSANDATITVTAKTSGQIIKAPPRSIGWYPIMLPTPVQCAFLFEGERSTIDSVTINVAFANVAFVAVPYSLDPPGSDAVPRLSGAVINATAAGNNTIVAAVAGQITRVFRMYFTVSAPTEIIIVRGVTALTGPMLIYSGLVLDYSMEPWYTTEANEAFIIYSSNAVTIAGRIEYLQGA